MMVPKNCVECICCEGAGKLYIGESDPIEGNKLRDRVECKVCKGSKYVPKNTPLGKAIIAFQRVFADEQDRIRREREEAERRKRELRQQALAKLTPEEREALGIS